MKVIKDLSENIECILNMAEDNIKKAVQYKIDYPLAAKAFYNQSVVLMDSLKVQHDSVVAIIEAYRKEKGEPPAPMMAIYNYLHGRHINQSAAIKHLQDVYIDT